MGIVSKSQWNGSRPRVPTGLLFTLLAGVLLAGCVGFSDPASDRIREAMAIQVEPVDLGGEEAPEVSYSAEVLMARAEGYYTARQFADAAAEYQRFMELHAAHPWAPYALFREGMSYVNQIRGADREPSLPQRARQAFLNLVARYPDSVAVAEAQQKAEWANDQLALHELSVAEFYLRTQRYPAALARLAVLRDQYPASTTARTATYMEGRVRRKMGDDAAAAQAFSAFLANSDGNERRERRAQRALGRLQGG